MNVATRVLLTALTAAVLGWFAGPAAADPGPGRGGGTWADEQTLAAKFAPVMMLAKQPEQCGPGEPYQPSDVDPLLDNPEIGLRGPWTGRDLVDVGPGAKRLAQGLPGYSLDFPGNALSPGCDYEQWVDRLWKASPATIYAHVATEKGYPGRIALQYWFFYPYNDFNNKHEGDWERIQLEFDEPDAGSALNATPVLVAYSQHYGSENATWGDQKLQIQDGTHPVVYVAKGSHASQFTSNLFLGRSAAQGFGCDTTLGPNRAVRPVVKTIPSDPAEARKAFPWVTFRGYWGERGPQVFYDGPTGPITKAAWTEPFTWSKDGRPRSYAVPGGQAYGGPGTAFFCTAVGAGSEVLRTLTVKPFVTLGILAAALVVVVWLVRRTSWGESTPFPAARPRTVGQIIAVSWALLRSRLWLFAAIAVPVAVVSVGATALQQVLLPDDPNAAPPAWLTLTHAGLLVLTLVVSQAATAHVVTDLDAGRHVTTMGAYTAALRRTVPLLGTFALVAVVLAVLGASVVLSIVALVLVWAWSLFVPVVALEPTWGFPALRRSWRLVRPQRVTVLGTLLLAVLLGSVVGGLLATLVILVAQAPFVVVNMLPGLAALLLQPFVGLMVVYAYYNGRVRADQPEPPDVPNHDTEQRQSPLAPSLPGGNP